MKLPRCLLFVPKHRINIIWLFLIRIFYFKCLSQLPVNSNHSSHCCQISFVHACSKIGFLVVCFMLLMDMRRLNSILQAILRATMRRVCCIQWQFRCTFGWETSLLKEVIIWGLYTNRVLIFVADLTLLGAISCSFGKYFPYHRRFACLELQTWWFSSFFRVRVFLAVLS